MSRESPAPGNFQLCTVTETGRWKGLDLRWSARIVTRIITYRNAMVLHRNLNL
jgi:hypothetical protein